MKRLETPAKITALHDAACADRAGPATRGELRRALWIQTAALISAQIAIASAIIFLLRA